MTSHLSTVAPKSLRGTDSNPLLRLYAQVSGLVARCQSEKAAVRLQLVDSEGDTVVDVKGRLQDYIWWGKGQRGFAAQIKP